MCDYLKYSKGCQNCNSYRINCTFLCFFSIQESYISETDDILNLDLRFSCSRKSIIPKKLEINLSIYTCMVIRIIINYFFCELRHEQ